jgi:excinuclease ABC subunit C
MTLDEKLKEIPRSPGVYLHKDAGGKIIYIGKAKNLRNRVRSYFQAGRAGDFSYFNYKLKDDKSYPHLKLTVNEPFPKCVITRRIQNDGALYFGPFLPAAMARRTIRQTRSAHVACFGRDAL